MNAPLKPPSHADILGAQLAAARAILTASEHHLDKMTIRLATRDFHHSGEACPLDRAALRKAIRRRDLAEKQLAELKAQMLDAPQRSDLRNTDDELDALIAALEDRGGPAEPGERLLATQLVDCGRRM